MDNVYEIEITKNLIIDNGEAFLHTIAFITRQKSVDINNILNFINTEKHTTFYFNDDFQMCSKNEATICWLDTGYLNKLNEPIFISLYKVRDSYSDYFTGHMVGYGEFIIRYFLDRHNNRRHIIAGNLAKFQKKYDNLVSDRLIQHLSIDNPLDENELEEIEQKIANSKSQDCSTSTTETGKNTSKSPYINVDTNLVDEVWDTLLINNWHSKAGLQKYLGSIGRRSVDIVKEQNELFYVSNNIKSIIVNTGLINVFGQDILVMYRFNVTNQVYEPYKVIDSKSAYLSNDFTKEQANKTLEPISFFDEEEVLSANMDDFDISLRNLIHIIDQRRDRFPEEIQNKQNNEIADKLLKSLERNLLLQKHDRNFAKPIYSCKIGKITWVMPFYINNSFPSEPELAMVVRKEGEFFELKTILPYDELLEDRINSLSLYKDVW